MTARGPQGDSVVEADAATTGADADGGTELGGVAVELDVVDRQPASSTAMTMNERRLMMSLPLRSGIGAFRYAASPRLSRRCRSSRMAAAAALGAAPLTTSAPIFSDNSIASNA